MPSLNDVLKTSPGMSIKRPGSKIVLPNKYGYTPKPGDEKKFVSAHAVERHDDKVGNTEDIFAAANVKAFARMAHRFGYDPHDDEKAEFAADKGAEKQEIATVAQANEEELTEEELDLMWEMASQIDETTVHAACRMAQELADKFGRSHFVHSYTPDYRRPEHKRYGVVSKDHYDNDDNRRWGYHITNIIHPKPFEPLKAMPMPKFKTKSAKKAVKVSMREELKKKIDEFVLFKGGKVNKSANDNPGGKLPKAKKPTVLATGRGNSDAGFKSAGNDNKNRRGLRVVGEGEYLFKKNSGNPTPGQKKSKRFTWLKKVMEGKDDGEYAWGHRNLTANGVARMHGPDKAKAEAHVKHLNDTSPSGSKFGLVKFKKHTQKETFWKQGSGRAGNKYAVKQDVAKWREVKEDNLNELSAPLLRNYIKKSAASMSKSSNLANTSKTEKTQMKHDQKASNREAGIFNASKRLVHPYAYPAKDTNINKPADFYGKKGAGKRALHGEEEVNERVWKRFQPRKRFAKSLYEPSEVKDKAPKDPRSANDSIDKNEGRIYEVLTSQTPIKTYIDDFQKSKNSRFAGKSKEERRRMAIGAFYHNKRRSGANG